MGRPQTDIGRREWWKNLLLEEASSDKPFFFFVLRRPLLPPIGEKGRGERRKKRIVGRWFFDLLSPLPRDERR